MLGGDRENTQHSIPKGLACIKKDVLNAFLHKALHVFWHEAIEAFLDKGCGIGVLRGLVDRGAHTRACRFDERSGVLMQEVTHKGLGSVECVECHGHCPCVATLLLKVRLSWGLCQGRASHFDEL